MGTFLGIASHELRTPLTSLKLSLQLTERRILKSTAGKNGAAAENDTSLHETTEQLRSTTHQMRRLERLVDDLVDVSRIQAGKLELRPELVDLVAIVREAVREQQEAAPERTIRLRVPRHSLCASVCRCWASRAGRDKLPHKCAEILSSRLPS